MRARGRTGGAALALAILVLPPALAGAKPRKAPAPYVQAVRALVDGRAGELVDCVDPAAIKPGMAEVRVAAQVTILSDGAVLSAGRAGGKGEPDKIARCLLDKVRAWRFPPPPDRQTVVVDFPIVLSFEPPPARK